MVNVYIDNLEEKNYMVRDYKSAKVVEYKITPEGVKRKNYLLITYIRELIDLYGLAKENVVKFLDNIERKGHKNILLYGAGEVAETIIGVIRDRGSSSLNILGIVDDDIEKHNKELLGYKIVPRNVISSFEHDAIVITSYTFEEDLLNRLNEIKYDLNRVIRFFGVNWE